MDEVWVPTTFQLEIMKQAGVASKKLRVVTEPVDTSFYRPYNDDDQENDMEEGMFPPPAVVKVELPLLQSLRQYRRKGFTLFLFVGKWEEKEGCKNSIEELLYRVWD